MSTNVWTSFLPLFLSEADHDECRCQTDILRVERVTREQGLHISSATLQSFKCMSAFHIPLREFDIEFFAG